MLSTFVDAGTRFEFECQDLGHVHVLACFLGRGTVKLPLFVQTVFGILGGIGFNPDGAPRLKRTAERLFGDPNRRSMLRAHRNQLPIAAQAAATGGNARGALDNSLWIGSSKVAQSGTERMPTVHQIIKRFRRGIASSDKTRAMLSLNGAEDANF